MSIFLSIVSILFWLAVLINEVVGGLGFGFMWRSNEFMLWTALLAAVGAVATKEPRGPSGE